MDSSLLTGRVPDDLAAARERYLAGDPAPAGVRPVVLASWERCRTYGVDPGRMRQQPPDAARLRAARARASTLLETAEPILQLAHETLAEQPHLLALADRDGLILRLLTGPGLRDEQFEPANLVEGASWHECDIGCNGVGTCLATGEPVLLIGPEHFQESYVGWTCIGVPIRLRGEIVGALDLSVPNEHTHIHTWGWTLSLAKGIEASLGHASSGMRAKAEQVAMDLDGPFHAVRGVFDLLIRQLGLPTAHAEFVETARSTVTEAETLVRASVARLHESEERLRRIAESGMVGVLFWELGGRITYANDRFLEMVGHDREDLEGGRIDWRAMTPAEWSAVDQAAIEELKERGATTPFEKEFVRKDGSRLPVLLSAAEFPGTRDHGITLVHDITERKEAEREIQRAYEEARQAVGERDHVLAVVSHDLRNPLNTITMTSSLLLEDISEELKQAQVVILQRAAGQMSRLITDLLDVSSIESGGLSIAPEPCRCLDLLQAAVEFLLPLAESRSVALRIRPPAECSVRADRVRILQAFTNLISNAIDHTSAGGRVEVGAEVNGSDEVVFRVRDTGCGIAPEHLPHVFDRFWRPPDRSSRPGAGLGLAIARGIVEAHGGRIWAGSEPERGSTFSFTLPLSQAELDRTEGSGSR
jgi:PAS domain S-box-containing protein